MLVNGKWQGDWHPAWVTKKTPKATSGIRNWITEDGEAGPVGDRGYQAEPERYHLYVALLCPFATRALIARNLRKLQCVSVSYVESELTPQGWRFAPGADSINGKEHLHEIYTMSDSSYSGRATVPVLWDKKRRKIVSTESADIMRMFTTGFKNFGDLKVDLYPAEFRAEIDQLATDLHHSLNFGVYRAGYATTQADYNAACEDIFNSLEELEARLTFGGPFLFGNQLTECDIRLFVTLVRFDCVYHGLFKCNIRPMSDFAMLTTYVRRILSNPDVRSAVDFEQIKRGYYSIKALNPSGIVPVGPDMSHLIDESKAA
ncbi:glutathione S-transferase C-terminal domain-containing protein [Ensifer adhaerens]|uniref:glutathione S-transferase family protein n=1 Tax=Ensifer adhaerens TaxID=106592 RepID=UPI001CBE208D|nr:glutathione S-transferase C-terminal domain-containing protein [Ensifer adhaerens]MBZ7924206.1 glutathione S-transferase C-terminal domain-containing protein [Ensifer adhaerens]UAX96538.1 glutathione S-transferase C-terminal domain-containing protein [Ensifer adhaerens]UAY04118.1 glutathione S-transferase C-terminal domain-containing protein [Ensifer adhaerens]UAY12104.1 glutathione S-transferase C-terminal domain-containing protein [Ensifer adhaerens]